MAKFSAYVSDSEDDDQIEDELPKTSELPHAQRDVVPPQELSAEEEEEEEESSSSSEMQEDELRMRGHGDSSYDEGEDEEQEEEYEEDEEEQDPYLTRRDPTLTARARNVGVYPQRMHVMQTSLFRLPEEVAALKALSKNPPQSKNLRIPMVTKKQQLSRKHSRDSEGDTLRIDSREVGLNHLPSLLMALTNFE